jgi:hypothetical protein
MKKFHVPFLREGSKKKPKISRDSPRQFLNIFQVERHRWQIDRPFYPGGLASELG